MYLEVRKAVPVWSLMAALLLTACAEEAAPPVDDGKVSIESYTGDKQRTSPEALLAAAAIDPAPAHQAFAFDHFRTHSGDGNSLTAPFDVQQLLASLVPGASGETLQAIATAGGWASLEETALAGLSLWEQRIGDLGTVERQRWLWGQAGYRFDRDYLRTQVELFDPELAGLGFRGDFPSARAAIEGVLDDRLALDEIDDRSRLVLAQSTRLQAAWVEGLTLEPFEGRFGEHEQQRRVPMLRISGELSVAEGEDYRAVAVPLAEVGLSLMVIIPAPDAFDAVRGRLDAEFWRRLGEGLAPTQATLPLPVFSLSSNLVDDPNLGIAQREDAADFSPLNGAGFLYLEPLRQALELQVDEAGLNAATVTAAVHTATRDEPAYLFDPSYFSFSISADISGYADLVTMTDSAPCYDPPDQRPFLFAVYARDTATLLHIGQVKSLDGPPVAADWTVPRWTACGDSPPVEIYRYKCSRQCAFDSGTPYWAMEQILTDAGIDVLDSGEGTDGKEYLQVCDGPDGVINVFTIHEDQLAEAEALGFRLLSELTGQ